jgi:hypothetical protein
VEIVRVELVIWAVMVGLMAGMEREEEVMVGGQPVVFPYRY